MAKVLIIEVDGDDRRSVVETLSPLGHKIVTARTPIEGLGLIHSRRFDLIMLDIDTPDSSGKALIKTIRQTWPETMVLAFSNDSSHALATESMRLGAYDIIPKPPQPSDVLESVNKALAEARLMRRAGYVYKDSRRGNKTLALKRVLLGLADTSLVGAGFLIALVWQISSLNIAGRELAGNLPEIAMMSLGLAFCYFFVLVLRQLQCEYPLRSKTDKALYLLRNISYGYMMYLSLLFLADSARYVIDRTTVLLGFAIGYVGLLLNRMLIVPLVSSMLGREGKRSLEIIGVEAMETEPAQRIEDEVLAPRMAKYVEQPVKKNASRLNANPGHHGKQRQPRLPRANILSK
jgi:CheY-like chemotaxis protein